MQTPHTHTHTHTHTHAHTHARTHARTCLLSLQGASDDSSAANAQSDGVNTGLGEDDVYACMEDANLPASQQPDSEDMYLAMQPRQEVRFAAAAAAAAAAAHRGLFVCLWTLRPCILLTHVCCVLNDRPFMKTPTRPGNLVPTKKWCVCQSDLSHALGPSLTPSLLHSLTHTHSPLLCAQTLSFETKPTAAQRPSQAGPVSHITSPQSLMQLPPSSAPPHPFLLCALCLLPSKMIDWLTPCFASADTFVRTGPCMATNAFLPRFAIPCFSLSECGCPKSTSSTE